MSMYQISINDSIARILNTPLGSRVMRPEFGSEIHKLIDRKLDDKWRLDFTRFTASAIEKWEKRVSLERIEFKEVSNGVSYVLYFKEGITYEGIL